MKLIEDVRLIIKICKLYYETDMSQKEISAKLKISRPQISRAIAFARQNGLVSIRINNPYSEENECERKLMELFGLRDALVVSTRGGEEEHMRDHLAESARMKMDYLLMQNSTIGVMGGRSVACVMSKVSPKQRKVQRFVPLVGGTGPTGAEWQANFIARRLAEQTGGKSYVLNTPFLVHSPETCEMLKQEESVKAVLDKATECGVMMVDIGEMDYTATPLKAGAITHKDIDDLLDAGAAAAIGCIFFGHDGELIESALTQRYIGISPETLSACPNVIAVAFGDKKVKAISAAIRSGYVHELITTIETARQLIKQQ